MELLQDTYMDHGMTYKLVKRNDKAALYQHYNPDNLLVGYDVFVVKIQKSFIFPGTTKINPEKEAFPRGENHGKWAWCFTRHGLDNANKRYDEICQGKIKPSYDDDEDTKKEILIPTPILIPGEKRKRGRPRIYPINTTPIVHIPRPKFIFEGKEYNSKADAARMLVNKGIEKEAVANTLKINIGSVYAAMKTRKKSLTTN